MPNYNGFPARKVEDQSATVPLPRLVPRAGPVYVGHGADPDLSTAKIPLDTPLGSHQRHRLHRYLALMPWPLLLVLAVQAALSLRLVWSNTAFQDEALYLWAGHLETAHWLHGTPIPAFAAYFSGAPVLYPPLGALADSLGGLAAARVLSLGFMLAATSLLWSTVSRLHGRRTAFFSCALFAMLGVTLRLGAFATYDAMALCLVSAATWCATHASTREKSFGWLTAAAIALALANATKYASALFDPVVASFLILMARRTLPWKQAVTRGATMLGFVGGILVVLFAFGGGEYASGITQTTLTRTSGTTPASVILTESWHLTAVAVVLGAVGALLCLVKEPALPERLLIILTIAAALLVPLEQARIHTTTSLNKHVDFGAWFVAVAAGYAVNQLIRLLRSRPLCWAGTAACVAMLAVPIQIGTAQAQALFRSWPNSAALVTTLSRLLPSTGGPVLAEHPSLPEYYLPEGTAWYRWSNTVSIRLANGHSMASQVGSSIATSNYVQRIKTGFFSVVILDFGVTPSLDQAITGALENNIHYHLVAEIPYGSQDAQVWEYQPQARFRSETLGPHVSATPLIEGLLVPAAHPNAVLRAIVLAVESTGIMTLMLTVSIRYAWRRRKESDEV